MSGYFIPVFSQYSWLIFVLTQVFPPTFRPISHSHCGMCYFVLLLPAPVFPTSSHFIVVLTAPTITDCRGKVPASIGIRVFLWSWEFRITYQEISLYLSGMNLLVQFIMPVSFGVEPRSEGVVGSDFVKETPPCISYRTLTVDKTYSN